MRNFEPAIGDNLGILEEDLWAPQVDVKLEEKESTFLKGGEMQQQSAFHFDSFEEFIKNPQIVNSFILTLLLAVGLPILGAVIFRIYRKMTKGEKIFVESSDAPESQGEEEPVFDFEEEETPDEPEPPLLIDAENLDPVRDIDITDEQRVLMNAAMDADDPDDTVDVLETLSRIQLHGKLATAQLRARTQKLEQSMTDDEREQERIARNDQLAKIFAMMQEQSDKFGIKSTDDLSEQLKLYSV